MKLVKPTTTDSDKTTTSRLMLVDLTNLCWIQRFSDFKKGDDYDPDAWMLIFQNVLGKIWEIRRKYQADDIVLCDEGGKNWRKDVYSEYKGNRSLEVDLYFDDINYAKDKITEFFNDYTNRSVVSVRKLEADDLIAIYSQSYSSQYDLVIIVSTDRDFHQLHQENVVQFDPIKFEEKDQDLKDTDFQLFLKCIRGDNGDNIKSAYPRIREKKLREAWEEESGYMMMNIMNTIRKEDERPVHEIYERNRRLIDLTQQPEYLRENAKEAFNELNNQENQNFNLVQIRQWLNNHELNTILEDFNKYQQLLN